MSVPGGPSSAWNTTLGRHSPDRLELEEALPFADRFCNDQVIYEDFNKFGMSGLTSNRLRVAAHVCCTPSVVGGGVQILIQEETVFFWSCPTLPLG